MRIRSELVVRIGLSATIWIVFASLLGAGWRTNWQTTWETVGVSANPITFGDIRSIPQAIDKQARNIDPYTRTPDTIDYNYPRIWLWLFRTFGIDHHIVAFELGSIALFLACLSHLILSVRERAAAVAITVAALSSVSFLAVERGNTDLLVFSLVYLSVATNVAVLAALLLAAAAMLKLYPAVCLAPRAMGLPDCWKSFVFAMLGIVAYLVLIRADLAELERNTPHVFKQAYGVVAIAAVVERFMHVNLRAAVALAAAGGALAMAWWGSTRPWLDGRRGRPASREALFFAVFGAIFLATFVATPNYEYRLVFTIPMLPFCLSLRQSEELRQLAWPTVALAILGMEPQLIHDFGPLKAAAALARIAVFPIFAFCFGLAARSLTREWPSFRSSESLANSAVYVDGASEGRV